MKRFLLSSNPDKNGCIDLSGDDYHYLVRVRRLAVGEFFNALLPNGTETQIKIISIKDGVLRGVSHCGGCQSPQRVSFTTAGVSHQILFQALPKADKMDLIVRQAAESGIAEIVPFVSEFSVAKTSAKGEKFSRWERLIKEARQQSGSLTATALHEPLSLNELFSYWQGIKEETDAVGLLFHHEKVLEQKSLHGYLDRSPKAVVLAVGPEGGFSDKEVTLFVENGFNPFTIGESILRTETAALYCAAAVRIILLERDTWELNKQKK